MQQEPPAAPNAVLDMIKRAESVASTLIGLDEAQAKAVAANAGMTTRVERRDGERFALRMDFRPQRIDLTVESGTVAATRVG
jgi:hypothetical protein